MVEFCCLTLEEGCVSLDSVKCWVTCERGEGVQGVLTLFCSGAAQVCHDGRVVELKEQLEVGEEDGDRQEEKVEEKGEVESRRVRHGWKEDDCECAQNLSHGM